MTGYGMLAQALSKHPKAGPKQASQEQLSEEREGLTYNQIRLILAMKQQGMHWDDVIVQHPAHAAARAPMQPGPADEDDDDTIPF
jgi:hypothetical protein